MLENLTNQLYLKDLILKSPDPIEEKLFDPKRDISEEDWQNLKRIYFGHILGDYEKTTEATNLAYNLSLIYPTRISELNLNFCWAYIKECYQTYSKSEEKKYRVISPYASAKIMYPDQFNEIKNPEWNDFLVGKLAVRMQLIQDSGIADAFFHDLHDICILDHSIFSDILPTINHINTKDIYPNSIIQPEPYLALRAFFPSYFNQSKEQIPWETYKSQYEIFKQEKSAHAIYWAATMTVLAADEVKLNESGPTIIFNKPKSFTSSKIELPTRRKF